MSPCVWIKSIECSYVLLKQVNGFYWLQGTGGISIYGSKFEDESFACMSLLENAIEPNTVNFNLNLKFLLVVFVSWKSL